MLNQFLVTSFVALWGDSWVRGMTGDDRKITMGMNQKNILL